MEQTETIILIASLIVISLVSVIVFFVLFHQKKFFRYREQQALIKQAHELKLLETQINIKEETMTEISRELHDNVGQSLSVVGFYIEMIKKGNLEKIDQAKIVLSKAIQDLRNSSRILNENYLEKEDLMNSFELLAKQINESAEVKIHFTKPSPSPEINAKTKTILYRICQEAIHNSMKHSKGQDIFLEVKKEKDFVQIEVFDKGQGFEMDWNSDSLGLVNMKKRAELIGAELNIESKKGSGTCVSIKIPFVKNNPSNGTN